MLQDNFYGRVETKKDNITIPIFSKSKYSVGLVPFQSESQLDEVSSNNYSLISLSAPLQLYSLPRLTTYFSGLQFDVMSLPPRSTT